MSQLKIYTKRKIAS